MKSFVQFFGDVFMKHLAAVMTIVLTDLVVLVVILCAMALKNWRLRPKNTRACIFGHSNFQYCGY